MQDASTWCVTGRQDLAYPCIGRAANEPCQWERTTYEWFLHRRLL